MLSREEQAEHNPEHDMEIEDTDKQKPGRSRDARTQRDDTATPVRR
jgi:hypothetical protein